MIDEIFSYATPQKGGARCRVRISGNTVIASELADNPGMSITNAAESVAAQFCQYHEIPLAQLIWIEHYPPELSHEETFDLVQFRLTNGRLSVERWRRLSMAEVERLFGDRLT